MRSTGAETGKFISAREHYDRLALSGNDPVTDPPELAAYMDGWDGDALFDALRLTPGCRVLEIGVGTGRLALRALKRGCAAFTGMDLSAPTLRIAAKHLTGYDNVALLKGEFPADAPAGPFERIYSSLTFLHIEDKKAACERLASLLAPGGRCVLSLDAEEGDVLDMGEWSLRTHPDSPEMICRLLEEAGLRVLPIQRLERAYLVSADRPG